MPISLPSGSTFELSELFSVDFRGREETAMELFIGMLSGKQIYLCGENASNLYGQINTAKRHAEILRGEESRRPKPAEDPTAPTRIGRENAPRQYFKAGSK